MSWISNSKAFDPETKVWYCYSCGCRRKIEANPDWVAEGRPHRWEGKCPHTWFTHCSVCRFEHFYSEYNCPHCGRPTDEEQLPLKVTNYKSDQRASYEYGISGHSWYECHHCKTCGRRFWFTNGDW